MRGFKRVFCLTDLKFIDINNWTVDTIIIISVGSILLSQQQLGGIDAT